MTHVVLSLGSNINRERNIRYAIKDIRSHYGKLDISPIYETSAVGFDGPSFLNLVVGFHSNEELVNIRDKLRLIESVAGRIRGKKTFDNRVLDIDVILFGNYILRDRGINIPRDEIERYAYVLKPLADLYPDLVHPLTGKTSMQMWQQFELRDQTIFMTQITL